MAQVKDLLVNSKSRFLDIITSIGMKLPTGGSDTTFWNTNGGVKTASEIVGAAGNFVTTDTSQAITGQKVFDTSNNTVPLKIGRTSLSGNSEVLKIGVDDQFARFHHIQDEVYAGYVFTGQWTDTENSDGSNAGQKSITFNLGSTQHSILVGSNTVLHTGNISPSLPISGDTIGVSVGGITSSYITVPFATKARYVEGDADAKNPGGALLRSGAGRPDSSPEGDTWIYYDSLGGITTPWGIRHNQSNNTIGFLGQGTEYSRISLYSANPTFFNMSVGIGTNSPNTSYKLHTVGQSLFQYDTTSGSAPVVRINNGTFTSGPGLASSSMAASLGNGGVYLHLIGKTQTTKNSAYFGYHHKVDGDNSNFAAIGFYNAGEPLNITAGGNVGVNTNTPSEKLTIKGGNIKIEASSTTAGGTMQYDATERCIKFSFV